MKFTFNDFSVGDLIVFSKTFDHTDFSEFSKISGDTNPLHHSHDYAVFSGQENTIVPLHLLIAPLSRVAGMYFPGVPSLYLGHTVRAVNQLKYGETLTYSAKITSVNSSKRILNLRVLGLREMDIVFDAEMQTHSLHQNWEQESGLDLVKRSEKKRVLITGSSGEIAGSVANLFHNHGWSLLLQHRNATKSPSIFTEPSIGTNIEVLRADLSTGNGLNDLLSAIKCRTDIHAIVHVASPPVDANLNDLVSVNYTALKAMVETTLPQMLANQSGVFLSIGSTAMLAHSKNLDDYAAAKSMSATYLARLDKKYSHYNVKGRVLAPTFVSTEYSSHFRGEHLSLLPTEVAAQVFDLVTQSTSFMRVQGIDSITNGDFGFTVSDNLPLEGQQNNVASPSEANQEADGRLALKEKLINAVQRILPNASTREISEGGLDITPGWDSLAQIQIILEAEKSLGIVFSSAEFETLTTFNGLLAVCEQKA